ncbi:MAG: P-type ATPase [bacterium]
MLQLGLLVPLVVGGVGGALWREYKHRRMVVPAIAKTNEASHVPSSYASNDTESDKDVKALPKADQTARKKVTKETVFDDVGEVSHYKRVSLYGLAFATSGAWFYAPATLISIPLISYNSYHFFQTLRHTDKKSQKSPMTVFESIAIGGTLLTASWATASLLLMLSFVSRYFLLQAGNIANSLGTSQAFHPRMANVWVLRDGAEVEIPLAQVKNSDTVVLSTGDLVMLEGKVIDGDGIVKQFSLHKKMKQIPKQTGDKVFPFTQVESGSLHVKPN